MNIFTSTLGQMGFLFLLIVIGYVLAKCRVVGKDATKVLGKLENTVFIPALMLSTFSTSFTVEKLQTAWLTFVAGTAVALVGIGLAIVMAKPVTRDKYLRNIFAYGLAFSNFAYMGNAVISVVYPDLFLFYLVFTLPFWVLIYIVGVPYMLLVDTDHKQTVKDRFRSLLNPMIVAVLVGMVLGLSSCPLPTFFTSAVNALGGCMSPVAMLITGITVAHISLKRAFTDIKIYTITVMRLLVLPAVWIGAIRLLHLAADLPRDILICALATAAMPLGLNTIVIPSAYGKDTSAAAGLALVSHILCCGTIPLVFLLVEKIF